MPSADLRHSRAALLAILGGLALALTGCATTQQTAARLRLSDDRVRAAQVPTRVAADAQSTMVKATRVSILVHGAKVTVVARLENHGAHAVSDLPISLSLDRGHHTTVLNATASDYFANHIPAIPAHAAITWVAELHSHLPAHPRLTVRIGARPSVPAGAPSALPITVSRPRTGAASATITNNSSIPQYAVPVFIVLRRGDRILAATARTLAELDAGQRAVVHLSGLAVGSTGGPGTAVTVEAAPTIFH